MYKTLDHFYGRPVEKIVMYGDHEFEWGIELEGGTQIRNYDKKRTALPEGIEGMSLLTVILSELDTRLRFGHSNAVGPVGRPIEIILTPTQYSLAGGIVVGEVFPQMPEENQPVVESAEEPPEATEAPEEGE